MSGHEKAPKTDKHSIPEQPARSFHDQQYDWTHVHDLDDPDRLTNDPLTTLGISDPLDPDPRGMAAGSPKKKGIFARFFNKEPREEGDYADPDGTRTIDPNDEAIIESRLEGVKNRVEYTKGLKENALEGMIDLPLEEKKELLDQLVEGDRAFSSQIADWAAQQQGFKNMRQAINDLRADSHVIDAEIDGEHEQFSMTNEQKKGFLARHPFINELIKDAAKGGVTSLGAATIITLAGGVPAVAAMGGAWAGSQLFKGLTRYFTGERKLYKKERGQQSLADEAGKQLGTHVWTARKAAVHLHEFLNSPHDPPLTEPQKEIAIHQAFNQVIMTLHDRSLNKVTEFQKKRDRSNLYQGIAGLSGALLGGYTGGALNEWIAARFGDGVMMSHHTAGHLVKYVHNGYDFLVNKTDVLQAAHKYGGHLKDIYHVFSPQLQQMIPVDHNIVEGIRNLAPNQMVEMWHGMGGDPTFELLFQGAKNVSAEVLLWAAGLGIWRGADEITGRVQAANMERSTNNMLAHLFARKYGIGKPADSHGNSGTGEPVPAAGGGIIASPENTPSPTPEAQPGGLSEEVDPVSPERAREILERLTSKDAKFRDVEIPKAFAADFIRDHDLIPKFAVTVDGKKLLVSDKKFKISNQTVVLAFVPRMNGANEEVTLAPLVVDPTTGLFTVPKRLQVPQTDPADPNTEVILTASSQQIPLSIAAQSTLGTSGIPFVNTNISEIDLGKLLVTGMARGELSGVPNAGINLAQDHRENSELETLLPERLQYGPPDVAFHAPDTMPERLVRANWPPPQDVTFTRATLNPDYDHPVDSWRTGAGPNMRHFEVLKSQDGSLTYLFMRTPDGRAIPVKIEHSLGPINWIFAKGFSNDWRPFIPLKPESTSRADWDEAFTYAKDIPLVAEYMEKRAAPAPPTPHPASPPHGAPGV